MNYRRATGGERSRSGVAQPELTLAPNPPEPARYRTFAPVSGRSMEPLIPDGSWCLFRRYTGGSRDGKVVLVQHHDIADPETGGSYTIKRYRRRAGGAGAGQERERGEILLEPENPKFPPIVLKHTDADTIRVLAELVEVLRNVSNASRAPRSVSVG